MPRRKLAEARTGQGGTCFPGLALGVVAAASLVVPSNLFASLALDLQIGDYAQLTATSDVATGDVGYSVATLPDFNGDAIPDLAISWPAWPNFSTNTGAVAVFFGPVSADSAALLDMDQADLLFTGEASAVRTGEVIAAGDFNGDVLTDLAIACPSWDGAKGRVYVVYGSSTWISGQHSLSNMPAITGDKSADAAGTSLATLDLTGDTYDELVIGAPSNDFGATNAGQVYVYFGKAEQFASSSVTAANASFYTTLTQGRLGQSVSRAGFVNIDAYEDLLLAAPNATSGQGVTYFLFGGVAGNFSYKKLLANTPAVTFAGEALGDNAGLGLAGLGDVNADGFGDFLISAPYADASGVSNRGKVYLIFGRNSFASSTLNLTDGAIPSFVGLSDGDYVGQMVAAVGDVTGDDMADFIIGAPRASNGSGAPDGGQLYLINGKTTGWTRSVSLNTREQVYASFKADGNDDRLGISASGSQDFDLDGRVEFPVGASQATGMAAASGKVYLLDIPAIQDRDDDTYSIDEGDCNDRDALIKPNATDTPYDGIDQNCDGLDDADNDHDGYCKQGLIGYDYSKALCPQGIDDCNDAAASVYPGAEEVPYDGLDQSCDGRDVADVDGDGYCLEGLDAAIYAISNCPAGTDDCDDSDAGVSPGTTEVPYDHIDQDCTGIDLTDQDGDSFEGGTGGSDCDDSDPTVNPAGVEVPYDGIDQNCDGKDLDDVDGDSSVGGPGGEDCDDGNADVYPGALEVCDGIDNDCNAAIDELFDADSDGFADEKLCASGTDCNDGEAAINPAADEVCDGIDNDCDLKIDEGFDADDDGHLEAEACSSVGGDDCDDTSASVNPDQRESCNGVDDNCNGATDEDFDLDGDGYPAGPGCNGPNEDCDDDDADVNPGQVETPGNGVDDDCNPDTSEVDADGDGFEGNSGDGSDCDDSDADINPEATEIPNDGIDQDCSGEDAIDHDEDGYLDTDDCNDDDAGVNPGENEICDNGEDDNCDNLTDSQDEVHCPVEETPTVEPPSPTPVPGADVDGDGYGAGNEPGEDCNDNNPEIHPGVLELCGAQEDMDCDGNVGTGENCYQITGGCACDSTPSRGAGLSWAAGVLTLALLRRRRRVAAAAGLGLGLSSIALADEAAPSELPSLNHLDHTADPGGTFLSVTSAAPSAPGVVGLGLFYSHLDTPLQLSNGGGLVPLINSLELVDASASFGLGKRAVVLVGLPFVVTSVTPEGTDSLGAVSDSTLETVRAQLKLNAMSQDGLNLAVIPGFRYNVGSVGETSAELIVAAQVDRGPLRFGVNAGYRHYLEDVTLGIASLGPGVVIYRAGVSYAAIPKKMDLLLDVWGQAALGGGTTVSGIPTELAGGLSYYLNEHTSVTVGGGGSLTSGYGAPLYRVFAGLGVGFGGEPRVVIDTDGDGIVDGEDECVDKPEDRDGQDDRDGCPDEDVVVTPPVKPDAPASRDRDGDGVVDKADGCPDQAEDLDQFMDEDGCPDVDNDGDGVADNIDNCPSRSEDVDGFNDSDGCPDLDNDGDGIVDAQDGCPGEAEDMDGDRDNDGCPDVAATPADDGDRIGPAEDLCPTVAEDANGVKDDDGCPESGPRVVRRGDEIFILDEVRFKDDTAKLEPGSYALLDEAIRMIKALPAEKYIVIEGHTDNAGEPEALARLSEERAVAVKTYMVQKGLEPRRLFTVGYGQGRPLATNRTERGRERNRRVVFVIQDEPGVTGR